MCVGGGQQDEKFSEKSSKSTMPFVMLAALTLLHETPIKILLTSFAFSVIFLSHLIPEGTFETSEETTTSSAGWTAKEEARQWNCRRRS